MAGSVNKVILVGNLGRDPEIRTANSGEKICQLSVATSETWNDKASGERKERTEWHRVVIFNDRLADVAERFLRKGRKVYLEGALQTRKWTDNEGQERFTTEVVLSRFRGEMVLIDSQRDDESAAAPPPAARQPSARETGRSAGRNTREYTPGGGAGASRSAAADDMDDFIPFGPEVR